MITRILAFIVAIGFVALGLEAFRFLSSGPGSHTEAVIFDVKPGQSFSRVANDLAQQGLIRSTTKMRILAKITTQDRRVKLGEYALNRGMTPQEILSILTSGKSIQYPVTFPEGSNVYEMAAELEAKKLYRAADVLAAVHDKALIKNLLGIEVSSLEGYLFPETYNVTKFTPLKDLLGMMVNNFTSTYAALEAQAGGRPAGLTRHEVVTLASVVEKETGAPQERPMIASVFSNRIKKGMKLQSDPTIIYGIWVETGAYKQNITRADLQRPTPYNTYTVPKLPFGPIANPGRESLAAVLKPANSEFIFFVSRNDGTHVFTKTLDEHLKAVKTFQLDPSAREGKSWRDLKKPASGSEANP